MIGWLKLKAQEIWRWFLPADEQQGRIYTQSTPSRKPISSTTIPLPFQSILWIEQDLLKLNREIAGEDRPEHNLNFLQTFPKEILAKTSLTPADVAEAAIELVNQTRNRIGKLEVPFRKPRVEFTALLPEDEPGHIEFGWDETIIRIHPYYAGKPSALIAILCHELAHFILDHNGLRKDKRSENEKLTDLFVFRCGQGLIYLQGVRDVTHQGEQRIESKLGYLSLGEMAYAHVRCTAQHGLSVSKIYPDYFSGQTSEQVKQVIGFLASGNGQLAEMILCPNNHVLRLSTENKSHLIRCRKCGWQQEIWLYRKERVNFLVKSGIQNFDAGNISQALKHFREAQEVNGKHTMAFIWASRCLKKLGDHQGALKEVRKILMKCPDDKIAQEEMKGLLY
jgi:hypothetical protein